MLGGNEPAKCSFNNCLHLGEPGCVVKGDWERYSFYFQLLDEIRIREEFQLRTFGTKRESDVRYDEQFVFVIGNQCFSVLIGKHDDLIKEFNSWICYIFILVVHKMSFLSCFCDHGHEDAILCWNSKAGSTFIGVKIY